MQSNTETRWVVTLKLTEPALKDNTADAERLTGALKKEVGADHIDIGFSLLKKIPFLLRDYMISAHFFF